MDVNMTSRHTQILELETFLKSVDTEVTMILQSLQWDRKLLSEKKTMVICQYNSHHRVPPDKLLEHEHSCFLKSQGYTESDRLLPSPVDPNVATLVKLDSDNIAEIINNASRSESGFKRGAGCSGIQPLTLDRLQVTYTADERRAIHDAVVNQVPSCHDLSDLALLSDKDEDSKNIKPKSKQEILAELRDMKRRRTKYRVASKSRNYSDVLRDVINTQMELYNQAQSNQKVEIKKEPPDRDEKSSKVDNISLPQDYDLPIEKKESDDGHSSRKDRSRYRNYNHSRYNEELERRKRRYVYEDLTPSKYLKTEKYEKSNAHKSYKCNNEDYESDSVKHAYSRPNKRDKRDMEVSANREIRKHYDDDSEKYKRRHEKDNASRKKVHTGHNLSEKHTCDPTNAADVSKNGSSTSTRDSERDYSYTAHSSDVQRRRDKDHLENFNNSSYEHNYEHGKMKNKQREKDDCSGGSEDNQDAFKSSKKHKSHKRHKHKHHSHCEEREKDSTKKKHKYRTNDSEDSELDEPHRSKNKDHINVETKIKYEKNRPYYTIYEGERHKRKKAEESKRDSMQRTKDNDTFYSDSRAEGKSNDHRKCFRDKYHSSDERQSEVRFSDSRKYEKDTHRKEKESYK